MQLGPLKVFAVFLFGLSISSGSLYLCCVCKHICSANQKYDYWSLSLLYSNEREGIPVELIHLLDNCIEIPQWGIVRSLNVHVSGALAVWEYTKYHMLSWHH